MADLHFVDSALIPTPVRIKGKHFKLPDDFSEFDLLFLSRTSYFALGFPAGFHITDRPLFGDAQNVLHDEGEAINFNISTLWEIEFVAY